MSNTFKDTSSFHPELMYLMNGNHELFFVRRSKSINDKSRNNKATNAVQKKLINEHEAKEFNMF